MIANLCQKMKGHPALFALLWMAVLISLLCMTFDLSWQTNDDVTMSMIAHGYGIVAYGSPNLVFSNVLWGHLVRAIPSIYGVLGYSIATLGTLLVIGWATLYFLIRLGVGYIASSLAVTLLLFTPTLFPQFTVNAGLLTVSAILGWQVYARLGGLGNLLVACLLAFFGYLIRDTEFLLVLGVALPLLPWRELVKRRQMQVAFLLLGAAIATASVLDHWSYSTPEWQHFKEFNSVRLPFTDYGAGEHIKQHPEILARHGYSLNDVDLISHWFFVDTQMFDTKPLNAMLAELSQFPMQEGSVQSGFESIKKLSSPVLLPVLLSALLLLVLMPRWPVALTLLLCLAAIFTMGFMGRPGIFRVYVPLLSLLLVAPLMFGKNKEGKWQWMPASLLLVASFGCGYLIMPLAFQANYLVLQINKHIVAFPPEPVVVWGDSFRYDYAFPLLANDSDARHIRIYGLNSFTHAPFSVANLEQMEGRGLLKGLRSTTGILIVALPSEFELLRNYCGEHMWGQLRQDIVYQATPITIKRVWCDVGEINAK
ncbi:MAG: hypothetical protein HOO95_02445 [Gallionella sp.]|nr:hypothetical protein [Gallionella sp.]